MKIAILNDVHVGSGLERHNKVRAIGHSAEDFLPKMISHIEKQHSPDLIINLGDLIRSENREEDLQAYTHSINQFKKANSPVIHVLGNHDIKKIALGDVENIWNKAGFNQKSYGVIKQENMALVWLGLEYNPDRAYKHKLPDVQLNWLENVLNNNPLPTLIFTHCAIDDHDVSGNYFYEGYEPKHTRGFFLENSQDLQRIISKSNCVEMVVQAHLHHFNAKVIDTVPYITCPSMIDNICAPAIDAHMPEIYSLITVNKHHLTLKAFSREYCFSGIEVKRKQLSS